MSEQDEVKKERLIFSKLKTYCKRWDQLQSDGVRFDEGNSQNLNNAWEQRTKDKETCSSVKDTRELAYKYSLHYYAGKSGSRKMLKILDGYSEEIKLDRLKAHWNEAKNNAKEFYIRRQGELNTFQIWDDELRKYQALQNGTPFENPLEKNLLFDDDLINYVKKETEERGQEYLLVLFITLMVNAGLAEDNLFFTTRKVTNPIPVTESIVTALRLAPPFVTSMRVRYTSNFLEGWKNKEWRKWTKGRNLPGYDLHHTLLQRLYPGEETKYEGSHSEFTGSNIYCNSEEFKILKEEFLRWSKLGYDSTYTSDFFEGVNPDNQYHREELFGFYTFTGFKQKALKDIPSLNQLNDILRGLTRKDQDQGPELLGLSDHSDRHPYLTMLLDGVDLRTVPFVAKLAEVADNTRLKQLMGVVRSGIGLKTDKDAKKLKEIVDRNDPYPSLTALWKARTGSVPWLEKLMEAADDTWIMQIRSIAWFKPFRIGIRFAENGDKINIEVSWKIGEDLKEEFKNNDGKGYKHKLIFNVHFKTEEGETILPTVEVLRSLAEHVRMRVRDLGKDWPKFAKENKRGRDGGPHLYLSNYHPFAQLVGGRVSRAALEVAKGQEESFWNAVKDTAIGDPNKCRVIAFVLTANPEWYPANEDKYKYYLLGRSDAIVVPETVPDIIVARTEMGTRFKLLCDEDPDVWAKVKGLGRQWSDLDSIKDLKEEINKYLTENFPRLLYLNSFRDPFIAKEKSNEVRQEKEEKEKAFQKRINDLPNVWGTSLGRSTNNTAQTGASLFDRFLTNNIAQPNGSLFDRFPTNNEAPGRW
eukprot:TRINITY_DN494_c0_g3_i1.p1 TRINITY_DN494_c0_g3~~TRINITY_DN494_c0_g3_i1.p1  ORF type:complete len:823 (+),score=92.43 TRINITY_DN494_c0_g3_i1:42-2471(+)